MSSNTGWLLLPLEWFVQGSFAEVLFKCLMVCPVIPQLLGFVFESRWVPWNRKYQFLAFVPGNPSLALFIAACSTAYGDNPVINGDWNQAMLIGAFVIYVALNIMDLASNYARAHMAGPTKIYHNALYFWYGYLTVAGFTAMVTSDASVAHKVLLTLPGLVWLTCLVIDSAFTPKRILEQRFKFAHADWFPIWKTGGKLRRRTQDGYELVS